jgi:hypothetical protein
MKELQDSDICQVASYLREVGRVLKKATWIKYTRTSFWRFDDNGEVYLVAPFSYLDPVTKEFIPTEQKLKIRDIPEFYAAMQKICEEEPPSQRVSPLESTTYGERQDLL